MMVANPDEITGINEPEQVSESDKNAKKHDTDSETTTNGTEAPTQEPRQQNNGYRVFTPRNNENASNTDNRNQPQHRTNEPRVFGRKVDESFGAFFPHAAGKSFTPRSQREREEAAAAAATAPIIIREPQPDKTQPEPKGKKGKERPATASKTAGPYSSCLQFQRIPASRRSFGNNAGRLRISSFKRLQLPGVTR